MIQDCDTNNQYVIVFISLYIIGGGGRNRTAVRKPSAIGSTCLSLSINLTDHYPTGREDNQRFRLSFNESAPNVLHRDHVRVDA